MSTLANAQPILTRRTADQLKQVLSSSDAIALGGLVEDVLEGVFRPFLRDSERETEADFHLAAARYHHPRLRIMAFLLKVVTEKEIAEILRSVANLSLETVKQNAWKLSSEDQDALESAFGAYKALVEELERIVATPPMAAREPFDFLMRATRMDFCLSASVAYLDGDISGEVSPDRVTFVCQKAKATTEDVLAAVRSIWLGEDSEALARWRSERLNKLCGTWGNDPGLEEELKRIYESRRDIHHEA